MSSPRPRRLIAAIIAAVALTASVAACTDDSGPRATDHPVVVASTDVWASVARAVAGADADVSALFTTPGGDPHEFEPTNADTARVLDANVIVMNGGHYDEYMERAAADAKGVKVSALQDDHGSDGHEDHDHAQEHAFYDLAVVADTASRIADALASVAPIHAETYHANAAAFRAKIDGLRARLAVIARERPGTRVAATEPLATALLEEAGISDVAPAGFTAAVEEGQSPSAADRAAFDDLLTGRKVSALIYNVQAVDPATEAVLATAKSAGVPVLQFTETLPDGVTDYIVWQSAQITALEQALAK
ncbi:metal ABC transporter substrate-binding protein [Gordonia spumicola]|uniref:Metal ABC transporter substrate-binding protein n=1 Tax=Gordonia spumicola TaxID=589161 RepID=A0A7I9V365_9ACTN|nr:zinc ABC transporter substrate-binding protein [Gordonia spumicola]GED99642.1 metal ABC transporter substrate-binding protein [Gordonia spumicola]